MKKHLIKFINQTAYQTYLEADDIWLPRVSYIVNLGDEATSTNKYNDEGPSRVEYSRIGTEFIQVANDGIMYFTDQIYGNVKYTAAVEGDSIVIKTIDLKTGLMTNDAYVDEANEQIVINYPSGQQTYSIA